MNKIILNAIAMKKSMLVIILSMLSFVSFGQIVKEKEVPQIIQKALHEKYPNAKGVKWDKEKNNYEASFNVNQVDNSILFNWEGKIVETEVEIQITKLPKNALDYINMHFKNQKVKEAAKIINQKGTVIYEAEIKGSDLLFDENGNFISLEKAS
ncbi:PepSY-like domain-containing protein [Flavobacterium sp. RSP29]|uniref:PepSY-like domain-containing protein n=1 Tax=Flavobacterium sp. RSP29 TaxID=3401731 RepID=UPI003AAF8E0D